MITVVTLAPVLFLLCVAVGVAVMNRARRDLTVEQKAVIFDAAPKRQAWLVVAMALVMAAFTLPTLHRHSTSRWSFVAFSTVVFALVVAHTAAYMRRLSQSGVSPGYLRAMRVSMWILWIAAFLLFATLTFSMWRLLPR
jgi:quinol-cytochrome oxidoreductase complex cytochrome b subunit